MKTAARLHLLHTLRIVTAFVALLAIKTAGTYSMHLWSAALDYFRSGDISMFLDKVIGEIRNQLTRAFNEGARDVGFDPAEFTQEHRDHLESWIDSEYNFVLQLAMDIQDLRTVGATLDEFRTAMRWRIDLWANRYNEVVNEARVFFGGKTRLQWHLGATEEHCPQCSALDGIVAFAEEWDQLRVRPQHPPNPLLTCGGWRCDCSLNPTSQRRSPQAMEAILNIIL